MQTCIFDTIPRLQRFSMKLNNQTSLTNKYCRVIDKIANSKTVYIFRGNNVLRISKNIYLLF